jgi:chorismate mutase/prephenate dehydratase
MSDSLDSLRSRINDLDRRLVELLNERARLVVDVGRVKRETGVPIYAPHREAEVLGRVLGLNTGPLSPATIESVYREIMSGSFALERGLMIGYLGPAGSHSHAAAARHFGSSVEFKSLAAIEAVFTEVMRGHVDYGLVPIENSILGGIVDTLDAFGTHPPEPGKLAICAEVQVEVHHALMANCEPAKVRRIYSKPEVLSQCRAWIANQYPNAELIPVASSSRAVQMVSEETNGAVSNASPAATQHAARSTQHAPDGLSAAIGSEVAGEIYDVNVLFREIEDRPGNITRFFVLGREPAKPSGDDKTSITFVTLDKPGALVSVLHEFDKAGVNLTHIDKRPAGRINWTYRFYIDAQGHATDPKLSAAIPAARAHCQEVTVLGSYPRSQRIL